MNSSTKGQSEAARSPLAKNPVARVVIVGAGFAGLEVAKALGKAGIAVTVIDRRNYHLFQPLLYQVATAALAATDIAEPIRKILRPYPSVQVLFAEVTGIDTAEKRVHLSDGANIGYDYLVVAAGSRTSYFGHDKWASLALGLKSIEDSRRIRSELLRTFENAERASDPAERDRLMTIAIIGGGPTGVELAGSISELCRFTLARDFRHIRPQDAHVMLVEGGPRLLPGFSQELADYAQERLQKLGVIVETNQMVDHIGEKEFGFAGKKKPVGLIIWAAGVGPSPLGRELGRSFDKAGRVIVEPNLQVRGHPEIFALGDIAYLEDDDGKPLPGLAQVAKQQGIHLGRGLARLINEGRPIAAFKYRSRGNTAIVGRHAAIFETERFSLKGWFAWLAWALIHVYLLVGFQHRVIVTTQWLWRYLTYERGARVIAFDDLNHRGARTKIDADPSASL